MSFLDDRLPEDFNSINDHEEPQKTEIIIKIAPPSTSEQNDRRAVRSRYRRERPRKLRPLPLDDTHGIRNGQRFDIIEPDIESFISTCFPGVAFPPAQKVSTMTDCPLRRSNLIRKRSLPSMSFLSTTTLAGAEKKRKNEEQARQKIMAEEAAKKIINSTVQLPDNDVGMGDRDLEMSSSNKAEIDKTTVSANDGKADRYHGQNSKEVAKQTKEPTISTTLTVERASNVLMPPLLVEFLNSLKN